MTLHNRLQDYIGISVTITFYGALYALTGTIQTIEGDYLEFLCDEGYFIVPLDKIVHVHIPQEG